MQEQAHCIPLISNCSVKSLKHFLCGYMKYHNSPCCVTHVKMPFPYCVLGRSLPSFSKQCAKKGYHRFIKSLGQNTFQIKIAYPNCWMPDLHKYRVMSIIFIYLFLGLIIGVKNLRNMCHLVYGQFDLEPLQFKVG